MMLLEEDVKRIMKLGYKFNDFAYIDEEGFIRLKNRDGHCVFLDVESCKCRIYEFRPIGCRLYPIVYVEGVGVVIDSECPASNTITIEEVLVKAKILLQVISRLKREAYMRRRNLRK